MADKEHYAEHIRYSTELIRLTWVTLLAMAVAPSVFCLENRRLPVSSQGRV